MKLIDKDALVAEIERRRDLHYKYYMKHGAGSIAECKYEEDRDILDFLNSLEVKEVDLEKEYEEFVVDDPILGNFITNDTMGIELAKHFFELGMQVAI